MPPTVVVSDPRASIPQHRIDRERRAIQERRVKAVDLRLVADEHVAAPPVAVQDAEVHVQRVQRVDAGAQRRRVLDASTGSEGPRRVRVGQNGEAPRVLDTRIPGLGHHSKEQEGGRDRHCPQKTHCTPRGKAPATRRPADPEEPDVGSKNSTTIFGRYGLLAKLDAYHQMTPVTP